MKPLAANSAEFLKGIDSSYDSGQSTVLRYRNLVRLDPDPEKDFALKELLRNCSIREGARIVELLEYKGVRVSVLDETSLMSTGSLKSIDGCLSAARCLHEKTDRIVFESGGNTGSALTLYGQHAGLETFFFCPEENLDLLDSALFKDPRAHLIAVSERSRVKECSRVFVDATKIRHVPDKLSRYAAAIFRGSVILEHLLSGERFDWLSQTVSAGFGPIGIYRALELAAGPCAGGSGGLPRFLGIQQEANCPLYRKWKKQHLSASEPGGPLLTRVMYDSSPQTYDTFDDFFEILKRVNGELDILNEPEFRKAAELKIAGKTLLEHLSEKGLHISLHQGEIVEKTGMIALAGTLKAIDKGLIASGSRILCAVTGGVSRADRKSKPEVILKTSADAATYAAKVMKATP